jgi:hypothetical protein
VPALRLELHPQEHLLVGVAPRHERELVRACARVEREEKRRVVGTRRL